MNGPLNAGLNANHLSPDAIVFDIIHFANQTKNAMAVNGWCLINRMHAEYPRATLPGGMVYSRPGFPGKVKFQTAILF
jgi:hypothetical protein